MSIPLRELCVVLLLLPGAMGAATGFQRAVIKFDTYLFECKRFDEGAPLVCSQENLLITWDVQLRLEQESREQISSTTSSGEMTLLAREPL